MAFEVHPRRRPLAVTLAIALATAPFAPALAGPAEDKATARELAKEGIAAEGKGDCVTAIDRLERAESLYHAPPHLQFLARCYTKVGRLVDAAETWRRLTLETLGPTAPQAFKDAIAEAHVELPKLEPRLARLTIRTAKKYAGLAIEVDGKTWPTAALDVPRVIDPGKHVVAATASGFAPSEQVVELAEGKSDTVTVTLQPGAAPTTTSSASVAPTASAAPPTGPSPWRTVGLVTAGVGVLAVAGGVFTGLSADSKFSKLEADCPVRSSCNLPDLAQRKSDIRTLETATNVLLIGGGILAIAGLTTFLVAPGRRAAAPAVSLQLSPGVGGGHVSLTGSF